MIGSILIVGCGNMGGAMLPEMMRWLWRDHGVSTDVHDMVERSFAAPATKK